MRTGARINRCCPAAPLRIWAGAATVSAYCKQRTRLQTGYESRPGSALMSLRDLLFLGRSSFAMDLLPYGYNDIFSFFYPRSLDKPLLRTSATWRTSWEKYGGPNRKEPRKRYLASRHVSLRRYATRSLRRPPLQTVVPHAAGTSMTALKIENLPSRPDLPRVITLMLIAGSQDHHPGHGGNAETFRKIHQAYEELLRWSKKPNLCKRRGFPDKWFYDGKQVQMDSAYALTKILFNLRQIYHESEEEIPRRARSLGIDGTGGL